MIRCSNNFFSHGASVVLCAHIAAYRVLGLNAHKIVLHDGLILPSTGKVGVC